MKLKISLLGLGALLVSFASAVPAQAKLQGCDSAAANVNGNGGFCYEIDEWEFKSCYMCVSASGNHFSLTPNHGPTGCSLAYSDSVPQ